MGGGSGGGRGTGGTLKKGREERNSAARPGRCQRSRTERGVGWEGQENTWDVVWGAEFKEELLDQDRQQIYKNWKVLPEGDKIESPKSGRIYGYQPNL